MSHRLLPTLPGKRNIIGCAPSRKSFGNLSSAMAYAGRMRKAVETAYVRRGGGRTGLKAGVNESVASASRRRAWEHWLEAKAIDLFYPHVFAQKRRHIQVLTFHDCRLALFKTTAGQRFELQ